VYQLRSEGMIRDNYIVNILCIVCECVIEPDKLMHSIKLTKREPVNIRGLRVVFLKDDEEDGYKARSRNETSILS